MEVSTSGSSHRSDAACSFSAEFLAPEMGIRALKGAISENRKLVHEARLWGRIRRRQGAVPANPRLPLAFRRYSAPTASPHSFPALKVCPQCFGQPLFAALGGGGGVLAGFPGVFRDMIASITPPLPIGRGFRYADASQAGCCRSSVVERILGKAEVGSSILPGSTIPLRPPRATSRPAAPPASRSPGLQPDPASDQLWSVASCAVCTFPPCCRIAAASASVPGASPSSDDSTSTGSFASPAAVSLSAATLSRRPPAHPPSSPASSPASRHSRTQPAPACARGRSPSARHVRRRDQHGADQRRILRGDLRRRPTAHAVARQRDASRDRCQASLRPQACAARRSRWLHLPAPARNGIRRGCPSCRDS